MSLPSSQLPERFPELWTLLFQPGVHEDDDQFRARLGQVSRNGLLWTGIIGLLGVLLHTLTSALLGGPVMWMASIDGFPLTVLLFDDVLIAGLCLLIIGLSRWGISLGGARLAMTGGLLAAVAASLYGDSLKGTFGPQYLIVMYLLAIIAVPYKPWHALGLGGALSLLFYLMAPSGLLWSSQLIPSPSLAYGLSLMLVVSALLTGASAILYANRWAEYRAHKHTQKELQARKELLDSVAQNIPGGLYRSGPDRQLLYANEAFLQLFGYDDLETPQDLDPASLYADPNTRDQLLDLEREQGHIDGEEVEYERKDGSTFTALLNTTTVFDDDGAVKYHDGVITDISELKQREQELVEAKEEVEETQELFRTILNNVPVMIDFFDEEGELQMVNDYWEEVLGWTQDEIKEHPAPLQVLYVEADERRESAEFMEEAPDEWRDFKFRTKEGDVVDTTWTNVRLPDGRRIGIGLDISERKRMEKKLRAREEWLRSITQNISDGIYRSTPEQGLVYANEAYADMFGYDSPEELYEIDSAEMYAHPEVRDRLVQIENEQGSLDGVEVEFRRKDGSTFIGLLSSTVVRDDSGAPIYYDGAVTDITEQKRRERKLEEAKKEAEEANRLKSAFLANMSHEIRTPLTSIIGFAEAIGDALSRTDAPEPSDGVPPGEVHRFAQLIERSGQRLLETLNSVLDLSRLEAGSMQLEPEPIDAAQEIEDTAELFRRRAEEQNIELHTEGADSPLWTLADRGALERVLHNLLSNAVKFTESGGSVTLRARNEEDAVTLEVEDTGVGIDPEFLPHLFDAFKQESKGTDRSHEGSGLGMAVTKQLVDHMDGTIDVESEPGEGTRFTIRLPKTSRSAQEKAT